MSSRERRRLKAEADAADVELSYCIGLPSEYDIASERAHIRSRGIQFLKDQAQAIGEMGGGKLSGIVYGDNGVYFNVEVVNRFEQFIMNTCEEAIAYAEAVGSPNCGVLLDTFHMNIEEDTIAGAGLAVGSPPAPAAAALSRSTSSSAKIWAAPARGPLLTPFIAPRVRSHSGSGFGVIGEVVIRLHRLGAPWVLTCPGFPRRPQHLQCLQCLQCPRYPSTFP